MMATDMDEALGEVQQLLEDAAARLQTFRDTHDWEITDDEIAAVVRAAVRWVREHTGEPEAPVVLDAANKMEPEIVANTP
jgi:hypothetical protein